MLTLNLVGACLLVLAYLHKCLQACSAFSRGSFLKMLATRKANFSQCFCSQRKILCSHPRKDHYFDTPLNVPVTKSSSYKNHASYKVLLPFKLALYLKCHGRPCSFSLLNQPVCKLDPTRK